MSKLNLEQKIWNVKESVPKIKKKSKGFKFKYADLEAVEEALKPALKKEGLAYNHHLNFKDGANVISTTIFEVDNPSASETHTMKIPESVQLSGMNAFQVLGSALTYFRRYHLVVAFGLITGEDIDAIGAEQKSKPNVDHVAKVKNLMAIKRSRATLIKYLDTYKNAMTKEEQTEIQQLIDSYNGK